MPLCGFKPKMVQGIAIFSQGLLEATLERAEENGVSIKEAFEAEVKEITAFLEALEARHQELKGKLKGRQLMDEVLNAVDDSAS